ncbi:MAG: D-amino acid dehydrogenase [Rickettsiales bacterium]|nr:D-amino acid dehydrogenase [Rickettsiales bacterium]
MQAIVLGAGVTGVMTAYYLGKRGVKVQVIDRQPEPARECSFANGGQLSYSHAEPWANPAVFPKVFKWMFQDDAPLVLRFSLDPHMIEWGLRFLWNCRPSAAEKNCIKMLHLGLLSRKKMHEIIADTGIEFHYIQKGILHIFGSEESLDHACKHAEFQKQYGCEETPVTWKQCKELEPALEHAGKEMVGGLHASIDESGDIFVFTKKLAEYCQKEFGAEFIYDTEILDLHAENGKITHVSTNRGNMRADQYVMCMGAYSPIYLRQVGIKVPIYPMKGYSITYPFDEFSPTMSITDDDLKIVYSKLGHRTRVAGTAEFAGYNTTVKQRRVDAILNSIKNLFPKANLQFHDHWSCLRPSTPDGPPIVSKSRYSNFFLNTGNGTLGWTQGAACAEMIADLMEDKEPELNEKDFCLSRY